VNDVPEKGRDTTDRGRAIDPNRMELPGRCSVPGPFSAIAKCVSLTAIPTVAVFYCPVLADSPLRPAENLPGGRHKSDRSRSRRPKEAKARNGAERRMPGMTTGREAPAEGFVAARHGELVPSTADSWGVTGLWRSVGPDCCQSGPHGGISS
jgi:hypothetical protein